MTRLFLIILACLMAPNLHRIANYYWPVDSELYNNQWDKVKHIAYLALSVVIVVFAMVPKSRTEIERFTRLGLYTLLWGELLPMIIDKQNRFDPQHWYDFLLIGIALFCGMRDIFPKQHYAVGSFFVGNKIYHRLNRLFSWSKN